MSAKRAPAHLAEATKSWWRDVLAQYVLDAHHERLLTLAAESWDRAVQARLELADAGIIYVDRFGAPRAHPAVAIERDARLGFARLLRELDLDAEPPRDPARPPRRSR